MNQYARAAVAKKTGVDPGKKEPVKEWGLWDNTNQQWVGGAGNPVKGDYGKCKGIMKIEQAAHPIIQYKIIPYKKN